jgi:hypothetical protein
MEAAMVKLRDFEFQWTPRSQNVVILISNGRRDHKSFQNAVPMGAAIIKLRNFDFQWTPR